MQLCNYTLLTATVRVLESFLEAILWRHFQLFLRILNDASSITIAPSVQCLFQSRKHVQFSSIRVRRVWGCYSVVALLYPTLTKTNRCAGALPWKRNQLRVLHYSGRFLPTASLRRLRMARCISLYIVFTFRDGIMMDNAWQSQHVNYTNEFRERFEATTCKYRR
jgi:hypothetical protein